MGTYFIILKLIETYFKVLKATNDIGRLVASSIRLANRKLLAWLWTHAILVVGSFFIWQIASVHCSLIKLYSLQFQCGSYSYRIFRNQCTWGKGVLIVSLHVALLYLTFEFAGGRIHLLIGLLSEFCEILAQWFNY